MGMKKEWMIVVEWCLFVSFVCLFCLFCICLLLLLLLLLKSSSKTVNNFLFTVLFSKEINNQEILCWKSTKERKRNH